MNVIGIRLNLIPLSLDKGRFGMIPQYGAGLDRKAAGIDPVLSANARQTGAGRFA